MSISLSSLVNPNQLTQGTAVTATGTAIDFTGIPSGVKQISVLFNGISTNSASDRVLVRLGSGSIEATGYISLAGVQNNNNTTEYYGTVGIIVGGFVGTSVNNGIMLLNNVSGNTWVASYAGAYYNIGTCESGASKTLGGVLDRIRITTENGTDTFDAGTFNIIYQ
jgi:hypothetical protein